MEKKNFFKPVTPQEIKKLLNVLIDVIPPKLAADFLTTLLTVAINKSIEENIFLDTAKRALLRQRKTK